MHWQHGGPWGEAMKNSTCHCHDWLINIHPHRKREGLGGETDNTRSNERVRDSSSRKHGGWQICEEATDEIRQLLCVHWKMVLLYRTKRVTKDHAILQVKWKHGIPCWTERGMRFLSWFQVSSRVPTRSLECDITWGHESTRSVQAQRCGVHASGHHSTQSINGPGQLLYACGGSVETGWSTHGININVITTRARPFRWSAPAQCASPSQSMDGNPQFQGTGSKISVYHLKR